MTQIVFLDSHTLSLNGDINFKPIESFGTLKKLKLTKHDNILEYCTGADIIIVNKINLNKKILENLKNLKLICVIATGYNNVDIEAAKEMKVCVVNVPDYAKYSVSQHVFALILNLATKAYLYNEDVKKGEWEKSLNFGLLKYHTFELSGKTIGIIGFGSIGQNLARVAEGFNMKIMIFDINKNLDSIYKIYSLNEVLKSADFITIHCPFTEETKNLINRDAFNLMKKTTILINTARGGIVNEEDLLDALNSGKIAGAGIDVLNEEPPSSEYQLIRKAKNLIITPHTAWSTIEARQKMIDITAGNIEAFLNGKIINLVNK